MQDAPGSARPPPSPGPPRLSTPSAPRDPRRGGLLLTPLTTPRPLLPPSMSPGLEMRQEGMGPCAAGRAEDCDVG